MVARIRRREEKGGEGDVTKGTAPGLLVVVAVLYRHCVVTSLHV